MNVIKYWQTAGFWSKVRVTLGLFGPSSEAVMILKDVNEDFQLTLTILGFLGYALSIWMEDKDENGIVDIFENKTKV